MKKVPLRHCVGCGAEKAKKELLRVVRSPEGDISLDLTGRKSGRGAYVCFSAECLEKAKKKRSLERAFKGPVPDEVFDSLQEELKQACENGETKNG